MAGFGEGGFCTLPVPITDSQKTATS